MSDVVAALPVGSRVVIRWRLESPDPASGATLTDVVGTLVSADQTSLEVATSRGTVRVERARVVAAKEVPPRPSRRGAPHLALGIDDLQRVMALGWGAVEREPLGDWVLRASSGFTQRGNSTMCVGSPGLPLSAAVDRVEEWYAARRLPARFVLAGPDGFDPIDDPLGAELLGRGYTLGSRTLALTASVDRVATGHPAGPGQARPVLLSEALEPVWLDAYRRTRRTIPGVTETVLTGSPRQLFGRIDGPHGPVALARLGSGAGWAGLGAVWTDPDHRGQGLATRLTAELARAAAVTGIRLMHLQVEQDNQTAIRLYRGLGFQTHSAYAYLTSPASPR